MRAERDFSVNTSDLVETKGVPISYFEDILFVEADLEPSSLSLPLHYGGNPYPTSTAKGLKPPPQVVAHHPVNHLGKI